MRTHAWIPFVAVALAAAGCETIDRLEQATELAELSAYYAMLGTELNRVETQEWPPTLDALTQAASNPGQRPSALARADQTIQSVERVVEAHRPDDPDQHAGYQAARRMVQTRREGLAALRGTWEGTTDPVASANAVVTFGNVWMTAQQQFMAAVGGQSQQVFGPAAEQARQGAQRQAEQTR